MERTMRTPLAKRVLPSYTRGEEIFNMVTHIVGGAFGIAYLVLCVVFAALYGDAYGVVSAAVYGASCVLLFTMSSLYHGLSPEKAVTGKKVMQVLDHCTIFFLIAGTYTPISLCVLRRENTALGWVVFGLVWATAILGITLNAIDLKKYKRFSMIAYIALGWCALFTLPALIRGIGLAGFLFLLAGGILYTVGAVFYIADKKKPRPYLHGIFHIFVVLGSILHFFCILFYVIL